MCEAGSSSRARACSVTHPAPEGGEAVGVLEPEAGGKEERDTDRDDELGWGIRGNGLGWGGRQTVCDLNVVDFWT